MIRIASIPNNILKIEEYLNWVFAEYHIDKKLYPNVLVTITEAVNNAIIHGNQKDCNKFVHLKTERRPKCIAFRISDEGSGFDPSTIPDPTLPENIECCGGRGVFLMHQLSHRVIFSDQGRTVEIQFEI
ncbi:MAG: ATP-binding protein [Saprospiraceae bacterium]|jgi:serine/threonine-protein kinase RsbW|uniref:ATP-binding protein n=1 Tax=Candidatus Defluviibacterium haderslevense TaxID=2981993 RepID=A0A9D7S687_9BACT|nr:ATP-binding protein [Candidatus Defluviibacterium haderslevense]MCC7026874.1 ATP-binding protein [Saprospiraceae bacterium]MBK7242748.1 ATP-binding protein [Candidatus Defluviibacterium haderslevense]MBK8242788.1 ATP-binding protein [Candidatus Defluviibacterium haderslevense]MBK9716627.1 ATP-binding protein [Candidatus Defluviibacterium haderslevense]